MKRKILLALLTFVMLFSATMGFAACGKDDDFVSGSLEYTVDKDFTAASCYGPVSKLLQKAEIASEYEVENDEGEMVKVPVTEIRASAFLDCVALREVVIPASVKSISAGTFLGCVNLEKITVAEDNAFYKTVDGNLYTKDGSKLIQYALASDAKTFTIPAEVKNVSDYAFAGARNLDSLVVPDTVESLGLGMLYSSTIKDLTVSFIGDKKEEPTDETLKYLFLKAKDDVAVIPQTLTTVTVTGEKIGDSAFDGATALTKITIGKNVEEIEIEGFLACEKLEEFVVDASNENYKTEAGNLYSKDGKTLFRYAIGNSASNFVLPATVEAIEAGALSGCKNIAQITVQEGNRYYQGIDGNLYSKDGKTLVQYAIANKATSFAIPDVVEVISNYALANSESLVSITIPSSVTKIGEGAFGSTKLSAINVPASVEEIGAGVFEGCSSLKEITVPFIKQHVIKETTEEVDGEQVTTTEIVVSDVPLSYYFGGQVVNSLSKVTITKAQKISDNAFLNLKQLTDITLNEGIEVIGNDAFNACSGLSSIVIPASVKEIGKSAFKSCENITTITIPNNVTVVGAEAFAGCTAVKQITIGTAVEIIGEKAFSGCASVSEITIPASVKEIGDLVFYGLTKLTKIEVDEANQNYKSDAGDLYTKDGKVLLQYSAGKTTKEFLVASTVYEIKANAFNGALFLNKITVPNSVEIIGENAFANCSGLTEVTLPFVGKVRDMEDEKYKDVIDPKKDALGAWFRYAFGSLPQGLKTVTINDQAKIATTAFSDSTYIEKVILSSVTKEIENAAFKGCTSLKEITTEGLETLGARVFQGCVSLTTLNFNNAKAIGELVFEGCSSLKTLNFGAKLESIGAKFNAGCSSLSTITVDSANTIVTAENNAIYQGNVLVGYAVANSAKSLAIKEGTVKIEKSALENSTIETVTIPATVTEICEDAFKNSAITDAKLSAITIGNNAFANCNKLATVDLGTKLTTIGENAFSGCASITSITIPESVTSIGTFAFSACSKLKNVSIPSSLETIGSNVFRLCDKLEYKTEGGVNYLGNSTNPYVILVSATSTKITNVTINPNTKFINELAFMDCDKLTSVAIPASVVSIGAGAFMNCTALSVVTIDNGVKIIGDSAFYNCTSVSELVVPNSVVTIGKYAFKDCTGLITLSIGENVTTLGAYFVSGCKNIRTLRLAVTTGWKYYALYDKDTNGDGKKDEFDGFEMVDKDGNDMGKSLDSNLSASRIVKTLTENYAKYLIIRG